MKQPANTPRKLYHLGIYGPDNRLIHSSSNNSLRESVRLAGLYVADMDNYLKVYRGLNRVPGAYASAFLLLPTTAPKKGSKQAKKQVPALVLLLGVDAVGADFAFSAAMGRQNGLTS